MKLEDPQETWDFFNKTAGETYVSVAKSFNKSGNGLGAFNYADSNEASIDKRARLDLMDLKDQKMGEMHVFFKSQIIRAAVFFANPPKVKQIKLNQFLKVGGLPDQSYRFLRDVNLLKAPEELLNPEEDPYFKKISDVFLENASQKKGPENLLLNLLDFISGSVEEEEEDVDFGDQSDNDSIFMKIPVEMRLASEYFDVEISNLQDSLLTKDKLYEVIKKISILEGKSISVAKETSTQVIDMIEAETGYYTCYPKREVSLVKLTENLLSKASK